MTWEQLAQDVLLGAALGIIVGAIVSIPIILIPLIALWREMWKSMR